ncbi:discoidin domain-containing protein [Carboxylicivirga linearis]|uniref:Discoidin domain-containing protein n=1 Tax=Carboxylicivirga linearis TaxID=1628157 RepID=A0ABS5JTS8_9BACT|nr:discoidin domain-containing protein [Carboxylicivirga linearis]MBS2098287.1 discoidin domain-containing protein [Carboxylicivirga linearis]
MKHKSVLLILAALIMAIGYILYSPNEELLSEENEIGNEERPDKPVLEGEELARFKEYLRSRSSSGLKSSTATNESTYANGKLTGEWKTKLSQTGWYGYRVDNSSYDSLRNVFYVVSYAGHLYKLEYESEVKWTLLNHKIVMNPSDNSTANPVFMGTLLTDNTFRLIRSNDDLRRMEYSDDEGQTWNIATGANVTQSWSNQIFEITSNGTKRIVLHTYDSNYHHIYFSTDNGATYTESSLSFPISTYDMRIAKPFYTNEAFMWVWRKSQKTIDTYKFNPSAGDFELKTASSSTLEGTNLSSAAATYYDGQYHFYLSTINSNYTVYYSSDEGATWEQKNAGRDRAFEVICPDKPNMLISGFEDMKLSTDYGATWNGFGYKLGWDMQHMRTYEKAGGTPITLVGLDFGCYISETPEDKESYTWCNNGACYAMHYDAASSQNFNSIYMANQDRGATAYKDTGMVVSTMDIDGTDVLRTCFSKRETSAWTWFYYGRIKHQYNFATDKNGGSAVLDGLGNWWAAPIIASPDPNEDAIYAAYGSNLQKFTYDEASGTITQSAHPYDFNAKYGSEIGSFGYSELNRDLWYVALNNGLFIHSTDGGENWTSTSYYGTKPKSNDQYYNYPKNQAVIKASQIDTNKVYFAGVGNYFLVSENNGKTFSSKINGLSISRIRDFALSPDEQFIFAACGYGGAWVYSIQDNRWFQMMDDPIPSVDFTNVEFIKRTNCVRFATYGSGIIEFHLNNQFYPVNAPDQLNSSINKQNYIELKWTDNADNEDGFYIERASEGEMYFTCIDTIATDQSTYIDTTMQYETTYYYRVKAVKDDIASAESNLAIIKTLKKGYISPANIALIDFSSEEINSEYSPAIYAFDGDENTYWHTQYSGTAPGYPHYLTVDFGEEMSLVGFRYLPRQDGMDIGTIADYAIYVSNDVNTWGDAIATGRMSANTNLKEVMFENKVSGRYVKFEALSEISGSKYASAAEVILLNQTVPPDSPYGLKATLYQETSVFITWNDASLNSEGYIIEQWENDTFVPIDTINPTIKVFLISDLEPLTDYRFRLRSYNEGGTSGASNEVAVTTGGSTGISQEETTIKTYPNPFNNQLNIELPIINSEATLRLSDLNGKIIIERKVAAETNNLHLNTSHVSTGIYLLIINYKDQQIVQKVIKE